MCRDTRDKGDKRRTHKDTKTRRQERNPVFLFQTQWTKKYLFGVSTSGIASKPARRQEALKSR
jgi:hypothetical protein